MPVMDGLTATRIIRTTLPGRSSKVKIIAMTANVMQEDVKEYYAIGMDSHVSKPFKPTELLQKMSEVMKDVIPVGRETAQIVTPLIATQLSSVIDLKFIRQFTGGDADKIKKYTAMFLDNAPKLLAQLEDGMNTRDNKVIKIAAHSLKPQLTYMGVKEEASQIALIEKLSDDKVNVDILLPLIANLKLVCSMAFKELNKDV